MARIYKALKGRNLAAYKGSLTVTPFQGFTSRMRVFSQGVALGYHVMGLRPRMRELQRAARFGVKIVTPRAFLDQIGEKG